MRSRTSSLEEGLSLRQIVPVITMLALALAVCVADPIRRSGAVIDLESLDAEVASLVRAPRGWVRVEFAQPLPKAYPPHYAFIDETTQFRRLAGTGIENATLIAFLRIAVVQDRRDLLAFDPAEAMRANGWTSEDGAADQDARRTVHGRGTDAYGDRVTLDTIYVVPGDWGPDPALIANAGHRGPGWPGPGAIVQVLVTEGDEQTDVPALSALALQIAESLAESLPGSDQE